jgi:uncharacterized protein (TIGR02246 family)
MKRSNFSAIIMLASVSVFLAGCGGDGSTAADEAAIKDINKKWHELIVAKDAKAIAGLYAEDGQMLPPNAPKSVGRAALEQGWNGFMQIPGMKLTFETEKVTIAKSGELAVEIGTYKITTGEGSAQTTETGKSVVTWHKRDGKWQVLTDMMSSDTPPPAPVPTAVPATASDGTGTPAEGTPGSSILGTEAATPGSTPVTPTPAVP